MVYHFHQEQLRVFRKFSRQERNRESLVKSRFIINQHLVPNTLVMIRHLAATGAEIFAILAKPYSIDSNVMSEVSQMCEHIYTETYQTLEKTTFIDDVLRNAITKSKSDNKTIMLWDVGGYFADPISRLSPQDVSWFSGVVEDTTFGHNRYIIRKDDIGIPIFSVARSELKEVEARFVGRDAVSAVDVALRRLGITAAGRNALVLGYGMIGKNVARSLAAADFNVCVYDKHDHKNLMAFVNGFHIHKKRELLKTADIIFSATADSALSYEEIEECKNNVLLASVGSKDTEFDIKSIKEQALEDTQYGDYIRHYKLPNSKNVFVIRGGTAVNFIHPGQPDEIMDLVFSEIFLCTMQLLKKSSEYPTGIVHTLPSMHLNEIARDWLRFVN